MSEPGCDVRLATCSALPAPDAETPALCEALRQLGLRAQISAWDADVAWHDTGVVVLRSTWDYPTRLRDFLRWCADVGTRSVLWNDAGIVRWNAHKGYLLELASTGLPVLPTELVPRGEAHTLARVLRRHRWERVVLKPAVSIGAVGAARFDADAPAAEAHLDALLATGDALVQPYVPSIETRGERSLIAIDGALSHAVTKRPARGEFRIHEQYGGRAAAAAVDPADAAVAERVLGAIDAPLLYARVDVVDYAGAPHLMELELIEPCLFLAAQPAALERFAQAIAARVP